jgi:signal transduction histidine kinase
VRRDDPLIRSGLVLASELDLELVLQRIVHAAVELTDAQYGALGVLGRDGRIASFITVGVTPEQRATIGDPPTGHGLLGLLIDDAKPVRIANIAEHPLSYGFPANHPPMSSFLGAPISARGKVFGNIYLTNKEHGAAEFTEDDQEALVVLATQAGIAIENARLYEESTRRERFLDATREIATETLTRSEVDDTLALIARRARELSNAATAWIVVPEGADSLRIAVADGDAAEQLVGMPVPMNASLSGEVVRGGVSIAVDDSRSDGRAYGPLIEAADAGPSVYVPLSAHGRAFGTLAVANHPGGDAFDPEVVRLLESFGSQTALALEYARAQGEVERLIVLEDRERIAKELHDGVIQALFAVGMGLQGAALMTRDPDIAERIEGSVAEIDRVIRDLRNYIFGLRPGILADRQLDNALRALAEEFGNKSGVLTVLELDDSVAQELSSVAGDVIQLAREALSNVGRHSGAATCRVSLYRSGDVAVLEVDDDGHGFDPETVRRGDGLSNLEQRTAALGGRVTFETSPTEGTAVRLEFPL